MSGSYPLAPSLKEPRVTIAIDFGTTFSSVAYAYRGNKVEKIKVLQDWPSQKEICGLPYSATSSSLWYLRSGGEYELQEWGWRAVGTYTQTLKNVRRQMMRTRMLGEVEREAAEEAAAGVLVQKIKLRLAGRECSEGLLPHLPPGPTAEDAIRDYLAKISGFALKHILRECPSNISEDDIQWALTVPAIWSEEAKQKMKKLAEEAGLVKKVGSGFAGRGSPHPVQIILEPEAASVYFQQYTDLYHLRVGDQFLVVDCGGGTVDTVGLQKLSPGRIGTMKEVCRSDGALCGSTFVDKEFEEYLKNMIGCFEEATHLDPEILIAIQKTWESCKCSFRGQDVGTRFELPSRLAAAWRAYDKAQHDSILLSPETMISLFEPSVSSIVQLIERQLGQMQNCKAIVCVGGFSNSKYLLQKISDRFRAEVPLIVAPPNPEMAVCMGAVQMCLHPAIMVSRVVRKTYGVSVTRAYSVGDPRDPPELVFQNDDGAWFCKDVFEAFVVNGDEVGIDVPVTKTFTPTSAAQTCLLVGVYSTDAACPRYVTDAEVAMESTFEFPIPDTSKGKERKIEVAMFFGRTTLEVKAKAVNFGENEELAHSFALQASIA